MVKRTCEPSIVSNPLRRNSSLKFNCFRYEEPAAKLSFKGFLNRKRLSNLRMNALAIRV